jgi:nitric oxide reductase large subunit
VVRAQREFLQQPLLETLRWLRIIAATVFLIGVGAYSPAPAKDLARHDS